jgi:sugar porter (SP) family MFS transporter
MKHNKNFVIIIAVIAATGGLLFGFATGAISGAIPFLQQYFLIDDHVIETITTAVIVGAAIGAILGGRFTDLLGRKTVILISAVIFLVGAIWTGIAPSPVSLMFARLFLGIAIGVSSVAVPLYIAEIAPTNKRGALVSSYQLLITVGILVSYFSDLALADETNAECWRMMFYVGGIPAAILLFGIFFLPETPRWLMQKGREKEGRSVLERIESADMLEQELEHIRAEIEKSKDQAGWRELLQPWMRTPLLIAIIIMFFQQFVGINTVIYYSPKIFLMAGFEGNIAAIWASVAVGVVNVLATIISVYFVDRLGRRKLFFIGLTGIALSLVSLGLCFLFHQNLGEAGKWTSIVLMFLYIAFFAISIGPLGWLIVSEIFPQRVRGLGASIGSLSVWVFNAIVTFTFFKIVSAFTVKGTEIIIEGENLGNPAGAFFLYAVIALSALIWGFYYLPETKGVSLEDIENFWRKGQKPRLLNKM